MSKEYVLTDAMVNNYLDVVTATDGRPFSLIVSANAGRKTFPIIATALKQLEGQLYDLLILVAVAPSEQIQMQDKGLLTTPLGLLEVDQDTAKRLAEHMPEIIPLQLGRRKTSKFVEDKIMVLAAFLKQVVPSAKVLPLLLPPNAVEQGASLGSALAQLLEDKPAVVIAQADLNEALLAALEYNNPEVFKQTAALVENQQDQVTYSAAPAAVALGYAASCGGNTVSVLQKTVRGNLHHAAVMLWDYQPPQLSPGQQETLLQLAIKAIKDYITSGVVPAELSTDPMLNRKAGVFVTLRIRGMLRGCIGHMSAERPLAQAVQEMAVAAATSDPRFPPLSSQELEQITVKVAVLSPLKRIDTRQVEVGVHGLLISHAGRRGVLLPEVAADRGWDRETYLENLCYKAGLPGDTWRQNPSLYAFTSIVFGDE
jgi:AmmeMemoRadiSam system protein A/AmmeMemoRadiSam system protein B